MPNFDFNKHSKGEIFEDYIIRNILSFKDYDVLKKSNNTFEYFIHSNLEPDYQLRCKTTNNVFWIECKFNSKECLNKIFLTVKRNQYIRYKKIKEPVFYLFGIGENPQKIDKLFLVSLEKMFPEKIFLKYLLNFQIPKSEIKNFNELLNLTKKFPNANNS